MPLDNIWRALVEILLWISGACRIRRATVGRMATLQTSVSDQFPTSGDEVTVTLTASGLAPAVAPSESSVVVSGSANLSDGTRIFASDVTFLVEKPGVPEQTVVSYELEVVSGNATFTQVEPGVFKATLQA